MNAVGGSFHELHDSLLRAELGACLRLSFSMRLCKCSRIQACRHVWFLVVIICALPADRFEMSS